MPLTFENVILNIDIMKWQFNDPVFETEVELHDIDFPWGGHKYFAYDLVYNQKPKLIVELGTHYGTSFFSFCQSVKDQNLKCSLYAVDTWTGDPHASYYGPEVIESVRRNVKKYYPNLDINLLQMYFDEAVDRFSDNSIEILHIDGFHTYESVKHDFDNWLKKVTDEGIILLHDICVTKEDFGVFKLWEELKNEYSYLEFFHSNGLGVIFKKETNQFTLKSLKDIFSRYYSVYHLYNSQKAILNNKNENLEKIEQRLVDNNKELSNLHTQITKQENENSKFLEIINLKNAEIKKQYEENEYKSKENDKLLNLCAEKTREIIKIVELLENQEKEANRLFELVEKSIQDSDRLKQINENHVTKISHIEEQLLQMNAQNNEYLKEITSKNLEIIDYGNKLTALNNQLSDKQNLIKELQKRIDAITSSYSWRITSPFRKIISKLRF